MKHFRIDEGASYTRFGKKYGVLVVDMDRRELFPKDEPSVFKELSDYVAENKGKGVCLDLRNREYNYDGPTLFKLMELSFALKISGRKGLGLKGVYEPDRRIFTENFKEGNFHLYEESEEEVVGV